jgi:hypothetical protein
MIRAIGIKERKSYSLLKKLRIAPAAGRDAEDTYIRDAQRPRCAAARGALARVSHGPLQRMVRAHSQKSRLFFRHGQPLRAQKRQFVPVAALELNATAGDLKEAAPA